MIRETADDDVASRLPIFYRGRTPTTANRDTTRCTNVSFRIARKPSEIKGKFPVLRVPVNPKIHNKTRERSRIPPSFVPLRFDRERKRVKETSHVNAYASFVSFDQKKKKKLGRKESDYLQWISSDRRETRVTQVDFNHTTIHFGIHGTREDIIRTDSFTTRSRSRSIRPVREWCTWCRDVRPR